MSTEPRIVIGVPVQAGGPDLREIVSAAILRNTGLNAQAFSGLSNPSTIYTMMVNASPSIFPYYRELEEKDTAIGSALNTRRILALARQWRVVSGDPNQQRGPAAQYADGLKQFLDSIPNFEDAVEELLDAPGYDYVAMEILWEIDQSGFTPGSPRRGPGRPLIGVKDIIGRPQELFSFGDPIDPQTGELRLSTYAGGRGVIVPPNKFLVNIYRRRNGDKRGQPLLRRLFWPSWFKRNVLRIHLHYLDKGPGTVAVTYPSGATDDDKTKALEVAAAIQSEMYAALSENLKVVPELLQTTRTRNAEDFRSLGDSMDAEMTRMILGQTLSTRGSEQARGTNALGEVHLQTMWQYVRRDLIGVENCINEQLCKPWLEWNYGPAALDRAVRPYWRTEKEPPKDANQELDRLSKARAMGAAIAERTVYETGQIDAPEEGEKLLPPVALPMDIFGNPDAPGPRPPKWDDPEPDDSEDDDA